MEGSQRYRDPDQLKDREEYSDAEDGGVEIIDMDEVHSLDSSAPRALPRLKEKEERAKRAAKKREEKAKREKEAAGGAEGEVKDQKAEEANKDGHMTSATSTPDPGSITIKPDPANEEAEAVKAAAEEAADFEEDETAAANALDLSASEDEETPDDLLEDFLPLDDLDSGDVSKASVRKWKWLAGGRAAMR